jgi:lipopolysaccharide/colanic/teichoic acid biosynthesis glycosyltransferase
VAQQQLGQTNEPLYEPIQQDEDVYNEDYFTSYLENHKYYLTIKRILDIIFSLLILVVTSPLSLITALAIKIESPGPLFYRSTRFGYGGKLFGMIKFRSMFRNADTLFGQLSPEEQEEYRKNIKIKNDVRITQVGRIIRRTSIDELPQFINVIKGDMSVIGPRPPLPVEEEKFGSKLNKIMAVRPGITGPWQVNGRNDLRYDDRIVLNEDYVDHLSPMKDINILLRTVSVVFSGKGAA